MHGRLRSFAGVKRLRLGDKPEIESGRNVRTSHAQCQLKAGVRLYQHGEAAQNPYRRRDSRRKPPDPGEQSHQLQHASNCMFLIKFWQQGGGPSRIFENIWTRPFRTNNSPISMLEIRYHGSTFHALLAAAKARVQPQRGTLDCARGNSFRVAVIKLPATRNPVYPCARKVQARAPAMSLLRG